MKENAYTHIMTLRGKCINLVGQLLATELIDVNGAVVKFCLLKAPFGLVPPSGHGTPLSST